ncbi:hypothetical protein, variant [Exophiala oligosperma]|nr:hypothetical protein, variant [Exophiala oligosperma]KIW39678.1 hypothetical protein, variant [Exophiala oligosperma]
MSDGTHLIARVPYSTTIPKYFTIASEVATMDFLRSQGIPLPTVYGYSATPDNSAGVEYIIMEMLEGKCIGDHWHSMTEEERIKIVFQIAEIEGKLFSIQLPASGSIFYVEDLDPDIPRVDFPGPDGKRRYCIGPSTSLNLWYQERSLLDIDRGPFTNSENAFKAGAVKEKAYLSKYGRDRHLHNRLAREVFKYEKQSPGPYLQTLEDFLLVAGHICPGKDSFLSHPTIRHPDLNPNNISVSDSFEITGLIDWQHCSVLPLFLQCGIPTYLQNYGDEVSEGVVKPELPGNFDALNEQQQGEALETFQKRQLHYYYLAATVKRNPVHFDALWDDFTMLKQRLYTHASNPWEGDNVTLKVDLIEAEQNWSKIVTPTGNEPPPCPISYSKAEIETCFNLYREMKEMDEQLDTTMESLGVGSEGWVPNQQYRASKALEAKIKEQALGFAESELERQMLESHWPFDDHDEGE